jgi:hypothetical protein
MSAEAALRSALAVDYSLEEHQATDLCTEIAEHVRIKCNPQRPISYSATFLIY